ncbi:MAG: hypothetical protein RIQ89_1799 [Bacteroidota bacterium]
MNQFTSYEEALAYLYKALPMFHRIGPAAYRANLNTINMLMELLAHPHINYKCIHIAGTNGKGSTSHLLAAIMAQAGYKTGLYTSPHLLDFRERIKINGQPISKQYVLDFVNKYESIFEKIKPSFFEWTVALAFHYFKNEQIEIAIIETGLGGRLDATNVIKPIMSVITNIGLDHQALLGNTLEQIAFEKAGIIKNHTPVVIGEAGKVKTIFESKCKELHSPIFFAEEINLSNLHRQSPFLNFHYLGHDFQCPLTANYQIKNLKTALATIKHLPAPFAISMTDQVNGIKDVLKHTGFMGRWQTVLHNPTTIVDVGHNEDGIKQLLEQLKIEDYHKLHWVIGFVNDKDVESMLKLLPKDALYYACAPVLPRAMPLDILSQHLNECQLPFKPFPSVVDAFHSARMNSSNNDLVLVAGSTFIVAEALVFLNK